MLNIVRKQLGVTLVELLIGMLLGLLVAGAGMGLFLTSLKGQTDNIRLSRLNQDMRALMDIMVRDIRRAGFVTDDPNTYLANLKNNPFFASTTDVYVHSTGALTNNCIVYTYNFDNDKPPNVDDNDDTDDTDDKNDFFGFRLNGTTGNLQMRKSGKTNANCTDGDWESVIEPEVEITALTFALTATRRNIHSMKTDSNNDGCLDGDNNCNKRCDKDEGCNTCASGKACLEIRDVLIEMTGQLRKDVSVRQTIREQVKIRNDRYIVSFP